VTNSGRNKTLALLIAKGGLRVLMRPNSYEPGGEGGATRCFRSESYILGKLHHNSVAEIRMKVLLLPFRTVRQPVLHPL